MSVHFSSASSAMADDTQRIDQLQELVVDTIYMDDHTIINVRGLDIREAVDAYLALQSQPSPVQAIDAGRQG